MRRDDLPILQDVADYVAFKKRLRRLGLVGLSFSLICFGLGIVAVLLNWPLWLIFTFALGFLLGASWALESPSQLRLGVQGILLVLGGLCGCTVLFVSINPTIAATISREPSVYAWVPIVPVLFICGRWSITFAMTLGRKKRIKEPSPLEREIAATVDGLLAADLDRSPNVVSFTVLRSMTLQQNWRGRLLDEMAIFVEGKGSQIIIGEKDDVDIALVSEKAVKGNYKIRLRCAERRITGAFMPVEAFEKYLTWKLE